VADTKTEKAAPKKKPAEKKPTAPKKKKVEEKPPAA
jgi:hypothetical protein